MSGSFISTRSWFDILEITHAAQGKGEGELMGKNKWMLIISFRVKMLISTSSNVSIKWSLVDEEYINLCPQLLINYTIISTMHLETTYVVSMDVVNGSVNHIFCILSILHVSLPYNVCFGVLLNNYMFFMCILAWGQDYPWPP